MPSKGVDLYSFSTEGFSLRGVKIVESSGSHYYPYPNDFDYFRDPYEMQGHLVDDNDILKVEAYVGSELLSDCSIQVSGNTGNIPDSELDKIMGPAVITENGCFNFGLYYSDSGASDGLTNRHQLYGVVAENQSRWMEKLFQDIGQDKFEQLLLSDLVLPGSHDSGMYIKLPNHYFSAFANTQKDPIENQLALGARVFDFRPGTLKPGWAFKLYSDKLPWYLKALFGVMGINSAAALEIMFQEYENEVRHIHAFVPGETYERFLDEIAAFLEQNPQEIVVVNAVSNGIEDAVDLAKKSDLDQIASRVFGKFPNLRIGDKTSLKKKVKTLLDNNERLIIVGNKKVMGDSNSIEVKGSYNDTDYQSDNSKNVIKALKKLSRSSWSGNDIVELSLQMTAQGTKGGIARIVASGVQAASPLFATKPATDMKTYPWLLAGNLQNANANALITIYNDYYDVGLTSVVSKILRERFNGSYKPAYPYSDYPVTNSHVLRSGEELQKGAYVTSSNGYYLLIFQESDSNVVLYDRTGTALWSSATNGKHAVDFIMQTDGNLVVYNSHDHRSENAIWSSGTPGNDGAYLEVQDDGNLVIYVGHNQERKAIWGSGTNY